MHFRSHCASLVFILFLIFFTESSAQNSAFWVWGRNTPPTKPEQELLQTCRISRLYWHIGTLRCRNDTWTWKSPPVNPDSLRGSGWEVIPVIRLELPLGTPLSSASQDLLRAQLSPLFKDRPSPTLQLDFDCPTRLIGAYATFCRSLKTLHPSLHLEITALASWGSLADSTFSGCVDGLSPMFYDLNLVRENLADGKAAPLIDPAETRKNLALWKGCKIPWTAGLPYFTRLTLFDKSGQSKGHLRAFRVEDLLYHPSLVPTRADSGGLMMSALKKGSLANTGFESGDRLALRLPDLEILRKLEREARDCGAEAIIWFRLPEPGKNSLLSLQALLQKPAKSPLTLEQSKTGSFLLTNNSGSDLPPSAALSGQRGYRLRISSSAPLWRDALPGDFYKVRALSTADPQAAEVPLALASCLEFSFSHLPAGAQLSSGLIRYATGKSDADMQYQIITPTETSPWQKVR